MKTMITAAILIFAFCQSVFAESCDKRFANILVNGYGDGALKILATQEIKGGVISKNYSYLLNSGHWMTEMVEPANLDWVLAYNNVMYTSSDKGKSWKKIRDFDTEKNEISSRKDRVENAKTTKNAVCGKEELGGVMYDTVEADFNTLQNFKTENHYKYWVNSETGFIVKATYVTKGKGFESFVKQLIEKAPDLELPKP